MYKEAIKDWTKEDTISLEQYLYARNGMSGSKLRLAVSPHELKEFGIESMKKGWFNKHAKVLHSIAQAKKAAVVGMNIRDQSVTVKSRLRAAFFKGEHDAQMVYLIKGSNGLFKIGISKSPKERLTRLQTACGEKLELVASWSVKDKASLVEAELHAKFKSLRKLGEWFALSQQQVDRFETNFKCEFEKVCY
jgi:predicted GIY-YIG superfamily endonuclease